jgi:peptidyl-prolyl cis-trans isomerase B (cyclophilin B)
MNRLWQNLLMVLVLGTWLGCGATAPADPKSPVLSSPSVGSADNDAPSTPAEGPVSKQFLMKTSLGEIVLELDYDKAPKTCANFESYVAKGHYNGTVFHRVIGTFMIQGGGMDSLMTERPTDAPIENEAANGLKNQRGTIAMARTNAVHSATSQFFINVVDNDFLNHRSPDPQGFGYCVFGSVVKGMETVDAIKAVPTGTKGMYRDVPQSPVVIESITLLP